VGDRNRYARIHTYADLCSLLIILGFLRDSVM
jgi:hypothetical protein